MFSFVQFVTAVVAAEAPVGERRGGGARGVIYSILTFFYFILLPFKARLYRIRDVNSNAFLKFAFMSFAIKL